MKKNSSNSWDGKVADLAGTSALLTKIRSLVEVNGDELDNNPEVAKMSQYDKSCYWELMLLSAILSHNNKQIALCEARIQNGLIANLPLLSILIYFNQNDYLSKLLDKSNESLARKLLTLEKINGKHSTRTVAYETPLHSAIIQGNLATFKLIHQLYVDYDIPSEMNFFGDYPIHTSAAFESDGIAEMISMLNLSGLGRLDRPNKRKQLPLHVAISSQHIGATMAMIGLGADPRALDGQGRDALELSIIYHLDLELILGAIGSIKDYQKNLMLLAARDSDEKTVECIRKRNLGNIDLPSAGGFLPIHIAAACGNLSFLKKNITANNVNLTCKTATRQSPLLLAAAGSHFDCVLLLVGSGADVHYVDSNGNNALHILLKFGIKHNHLADIPANLMSVKQKSTGKSKKSQKGSQVQSATVGNAAVIKDTRGRVLLYSLKFLLQKAVKNIFVLNKEDKTPLDMLLEDGDSTLNEVVAEVIFSDNSLMKFVACGYIKRVCTETMKANPAATADVIYEHSIFSQCIIKLGLGVKSGKEYTEKVKNLIKQVVDYETNKTSPAARKSFEQMIDALTYSPDKQTEFDAIEKFIVSFKLKYQQNQPIIAPNIQPFAPVKTFSFFRKSKRPVSECESNLTVAITAQDICVGLNASSPDVRTEAGHKEISSNLDLASLVHDHYARRLLLLFYTYIALYKSHFSVVPDRSDYILQHGVGTRGYHAAHSAFHNAFIPKQSTTYTSRLFKVNGVYEQPYLFGVYRSRSQLDGLHILDTLNSTVTAPSYVNYFDTKYIEEIYRVIADDLMMGVINGTITPWHAFETFLIKVESIIGQKQAECVNVSKEQRVKDSNKKLYEIFKKATVEDPLDTSQAARTIKKGYLYTLLRFSKLERVFLDTMDASQKDTIFEIKCRSIKMEALKSRSHFLSEIVDPFADVAPAIDLYETSDEEGVFQP